MHNFFFWNTFLLCFNTSVLVSSDWCISSKVARMDEHQVRIEIDPESGKFKTKLDGNYTFQIDLVPNRIKLGAKSIEKG